MELEILPKYSTGERGHHLQGKFDLTDEAARQLRKDYNEYLKGLANNIDPGPQGGTYEYTTYDSEKRTVFINFNEVSLMC